MFSIIPSKRIYKMENKKVIKNKISTIYADVSTIQSKNEYDVLVHSENVLPEYGVKKESVSDYKIGTYSSAVGNIYYAAYAMFQPKYISAYTVKIPKKRKNSYVSKIYTGLDDEGTQKIHCSISGEVYEGVATAKVNVSSNLGAVGVSDLNISYGSTPKSQAISAEPFKDLSYKGNYASVDITSKVNNQFPVDLLGTTRFSEDYENYYFDVSFVSEYEKVIIHNENGNAGYTFTISDGVVEKFVAKKIEVSVNGDILGVDIENETFQFGNGGEDISFGGNELLQNGNTSLSQIPFQVSVDDWFDTLDGRTSQISSASSELKNGLVVFVPLTNGFYTVYEKNGLFFVNAELGSIGDTVEVYPEKFGAVYEDTLKAYENGKETAVIRVSIKDYGDERNYFEVGDIVFPMVFSSNGKDVPMSRRKDGSSKDFTVVGVKFIYSGAIWQELTLQERTIV